MPTTPAHAARSKGALTTAAAGEASGAALLAVLARAVTAERDAGGGLLVSDKVKINVEAVNEVVREQLVTAGAVYVAKFRVLKRLRAEAGELME